MGIYYTVADNSQNWQDCVSGSDFGLLNLLFETWKLMLSDLSKLLSYIQLGWKSWELDFKEHSGFPYFWPGQKYF